MCLPVLQTGQPGVNEVPHVQIIWFRVDVGVQITQYASKDAARVPNSRLLRRHHHNRPWPERPLT